MSDTKLCPFCAEEIKAAAIKCKHCGRMLNDSAPSIVPKPPAIERNELEIAPSESPQKPKENRLYSVAIRTIENEKAKFAFGKQLNAALKIPYAQLNNYLTQGKVIKRDLEKLQAEELISKLSTPGIQLNLKPQLTSNEKKSVWVVILSLIAVLISLYYGNYEPMEEPRPTGFYTYCSAQCDGKQNTSCINQCCLDTFRHCVEFCADNTVCVNSCIEKDKVCLALNKRN